MYVSHLKYNFFDKNSLKSFVDSKICYTFANANGKQQHFPIANKRP